MEIPKLNVNVGVYLISLAAIGAGEYFCLCVLYWFGIIIGILSGISVVVTLFYHLKYYITVTKNPEKNRKPKDDSKNTSK